MRGVRALIAVAICAVFSVSSFADDPIEVPLERLDNGDYSWARQVIPVLYGRKPRGYSEIRLVADLARLGDRRSTLLALMSTEEFIDHWSDVLMDHLRVNRFGSKSLELCYRKTDSEAGKTDALAKWIRDNPPDTPFDGPGAAEFTMNDVLRSSLRLDNTSDLSPVFLAHLFALESRPISGNQVTETNKRTDLWANFEATYLHRKNECLLCHNSSYSVTGNESFWNRAHPIPGHFESSVYGARSGIDPVRLRSFFRTDVLQSGEVRPWGLSSDCGSFAQPTTDDTEPPKEDIKEGDPQNVSRPNDPYFAKMQSKRGSIFDVERRLREGFDALRENQVLDRQEDSDDKRYCELCTACDGQPTDVVLTEEQLNAHDAAARVLDERCKSCHISGSQSPALSGVDLLNDVVRAPSTKCMLVAPGDKDNSYLWQKVQPNEEGACSRLGKRMPSNDPFEPLTAAQLTTIEKWITGLPKNAGCRTCKRLASQCNPLPLLKIEAHEAFALMVASSVTDRVWREALGYPLTISNYFPRSADQGVTLRILTETTFIANKFSLRELLVHILTSPYFNRRPADAGGNGYMVPLVADAWTEADPRRPPVALDGWKPGAGRPSPDPVYDPKINPKNHKNAATESIRRYPAYTLLRAVDTALGWPRGADFWNETSDPTLEYAKAAGLFIRDSEPGFRGINLQSLLVWESRNGMCTRPENVSKDWIDKLMETAQNLNTSSAQLPVTYRELAAAVKDWLTGELSITEGFDAEGIAKLFGWNDTQATSAKAFLDSPVPIGPAITSGVRKLCGVLLESPQFQLAGLAPADLAPPLHDSAALEPRLRVCNDKPCSYQELCMALKTELQRAGHPATCAETNVRPIAITALSPSQSRAAEELDRLCPPGHCYLQKLPAACRDNPVRCVGRLALCDPRFDSCGSAQTLAGRLDALRNGAVLVAELEGSKVKGAALGVGQRSLTGHRTFAARNVRLAAGDVVTIKPGQALTVEIGANATPQRASASRPSIRRHWTLQSKSSEKDASVSETQTSRDLTVIVTGPTLRARMAAETAAPPPSASALGSEREAQWLRHGEAGPPLRSSLSAPPPIDTGALEKRRRILKAARDAAAARPKD